jgi:hypothetical protein
MKIRLTESQFKKLFLKEEINKYVTPSDVEEVVKELVSMGFTERRFGTEPDKYITLSYKGELKDCENTGKKKIVVTYFEDDIWKNRWKVTVGKCGTIEKEKYWNNPNSSDPLSTDKIIELVNKLKNKFG